MAKQGSHPLRIADNSGHKMSFHRARYEIVSYQLSALKLKTWTEMPFSMGASLNSGRFL